MGCIVRKFNRTVSNFDFRIRREILQEKLTELCQFLTLKLYGYICSGGYLRENLTELCQFLTLELYGLYSEKI